MCAAAVAASGHGAGPRLDLTDRSCAGRPCRPTTATRLRRRRAIVPARRPYWRWERRLCRRRTSASPTPAWTSSSGTTALVAYILRHTVVGTHVVDWTTLSKVDDTRRIYGGFVGYNSQWDGNVILGVELNYSRIFNGGLGGSVTGFDDAQFNDDAQAPAPHHYFYTATVTGSASARHHRLRDGARPRRLRVRQVHALCVRRRGASAASISSAAPPCPISVRTFPTCRRRRRRSAAADPLITFGSADPERDTKNNTFALRLCRGSRHRRRSDAERVRARRIGIHPVHAGAGFQNPHQHRARRRRHQVLEPSARPICRLAHTASTLRLTRRVYLPYSGGGTPLPTEGLLSGRIDDMSKSRPACGRSSRTFRPAPAPSAPAGACKPSPTPFWDARTAPRSARRSSSAPSI